MKKAQVITLNDIFAWAITVLLVIIVLIVLKNMNFNEYKGYIEEVDDWDQKGIFINLMRTEIDGKEMADMFHFAYKNKGLEPDPETGQQYSGSKLKQEFADELNILLEKFYEGEVCWKLYVYEQFTENYPMPDDYNPIKSPVFAGSPDDCDTDSKKDFLDSTIYYPYLHGEHTYLNMTLIVMGYKK